MYGYAVTMHIGFGCAETPREGQYLGRKMPSGTSSMGM